MKIIWHIYRNLLSHADADQLESFIAAAAVGSFRAAAEQLRVSQPTVSARIKGLEDWLNRPLFTGAREPASP